MNGAPQEHSDHETGLPVLRTWRAVYWFVTITFVIYVALLAALTGLNS